MSTPKRYVSESDLRRSIATLDTKPSKAKEPIRAYPSRSSRVYRVRVPEGHMTIPEIARKHDISSVVLYERLRRRRVPYSHPPYSPRSIKIEDVPRLVNHDPEDKPGRPVTRLPPAPWLCIRFRLDPEKQAAWEEAAGSKNPYKIMRWLEKLAESEIKRQSSTLAPLHSAIDQFLADIENIAKRYSP